MYSVCIDVYVYLLVVMSVLCVLLPMGIHVCVLCAYRCLCVFMCTDVCENLQDIDASVYFMDDG